MVNLSDYRIKTEKEFIDEFGEDWRSELGQSFVPEMDCLLGMSLDKITFDADDDVNEWVENGDPIDDVYVCAPAQGYWITRDMVTDKKLPTDKPKKAVKPKKKAVKPKEWYESGHHYDIEMSVSGRDTSVTIWFDNKSFEGKARTHEGEQNVPAVGFIVALSRAVEKAKKVLGRIPAVHNVFDDMN